jgi:hypothetical protein
MVGVGVMIGIDCTGPQLALVNDTFQDRASAIQNGQEPLVIPVPSPTG